MAANLLTNLYAIQKGSQNVQQGLDLASFSAGLSQQGTAIAVAGYNQAGQAAIQASQYNANLVATNLAQALDVMSRQIYAGQAQNRMAESGTGFSVGSKSFMQIAHANLSVYEREIANQQDVASQKQQSILFSGQAMAQSYANKAQQSIFQGQADVAKANFLQDQYDSYGGTQTGSPNASNVSNLSDYGT